MASKQPNDDPILQRLDTLIRLQARIAVSSVKEQRDKVMFLSGAGMTPKMISELLEMTPNAVSSVLKRARKVKSSKADGEDPDQ